MQSRVQSLYTRGGGGGGGGEEEEEKEEDEGCVVDIFDSVLDDI